MSDDEYAPPTTREEVAGRLETLKAKRGYLLPHHGLLAVAEPGLLAAYDATYTALTLTPRVLSEHAKEVVWLAILVSTEEAIATHHLARLRAGGGSDADVELAVRLAAYARGAQHFDFVGKHWGPHMPDYDAVRAYRDGLTALVRLSPVPAGWVELAMAAVHTCHRRWGWLREHLAGAYREGVEERAIAEALSLTMFPGGVPNFVDAADHWRQMILEGVVSPSPPFRAWADLSGQGGFDEASGVD